MYYPDPSGPGGLGTSENWVWDNFNRDPHAKVALVQTAENVAAKFGISRAEQDELTLHRYGQYKMALADDRAFQRGYMQEVDLIPSSIEGDSFRGFPNGKKSESMGRTDTEVRYGQSGCVTGRF